MLSSGAVAADSNGFFHPLGDHAQTSFSIDGQPISDQQSKGFSTQIPVDAIQSAVSSSALSVLPAVLLQVSLEGRRPGLVRAGYLLSAFAVVLHFLEIGRSGIGMHQVSLLLITGGFLGLTALALLRDRHPSIQGDSRGGIRILASMRLALFATSFIHFGAGHVNEAWSSELIIHHAGIPLALFILLQDYRFVLLDAFVRFLAKCVARCDSRRSGNRYGISSRPGRTRGRATAGGRPAAHRLS